MPVDLDGAPPMDMILNHGALTCSAMDDLACGATGCLASVWQAVGQSGAGTYIQVFHDAVQGITPDTPGALRLSLQGALCGRSAGACEQIWTLQDGVLQPAR